MPNPKIDILGVNPHTRKLKLSDGGRTEVDSKSEYREVTWGIPDLTGEVRLLKIVGKTGHNPFTTAIPPRHHTEVKLKVKKGHPHMDWEYAINWTDDHGKEHVSDPLIAINPSK